MLTINKFAVMYKGAQKMWCSIRMFCSEHICQLYFHHVCEAKWRHLANENHSDASPIRFQEIITNNQFYNDVTEAETDRKINKLREHFTVY